jgi:hypothetical protein
MVFMSVGGQKEEVCAAMSTLILQPRRCCYTGGHGASLLSLTSRQIQSVDAVTNIEMQQGV